MISIQEVDRIAKLAKLTFDESEKQKLSKELSDILNYVDQLKEIEGQGSDMDIDPISLNLMRDDIAEQKTNPEEFLAQAHAKEGKFVKVKSILE